MPFDYRNPFGYIIVYSFTSIAVFYIVEESAAVGSFIIGSCFLLISFTRDIKEMMYNLSECDKTMSKPFEIKKKLSEIIQFHANAMKLFFFYHNIFFIIENILISVSPANLTNHMNLFSPVFFFIWSLLTICFVKLY